MPPVGAETADGGDEEPAPDEAPEAARAKPPARRPRPAARKSDKGGE
jgi:hypothetical protein